MKAIIKKVITALAIFLFLIGIALIIWANFCTDFIQNLLLSLGSNFLTSMIVYFFLDYFLEAENSKENKKKRVYAFEYMEDEMQDIKLYYWNLYQSVPNGSVHNENDLFLKPEAFLQVSSRIKLGEPPFRTYTNRISIPTKMEEFRILLIETKGKTSKILSDYGYLLTDTELYAFREAIKAFAPNPIVFLNLDIPIEPRDFCELVFAEENIIPIFSFFVLLSTKK